MSKFYKNIFFVGILIFTFYHHTFSIAATIINTNKCAGLFSFTKIFKDLWIKDLAQYALLKAKPTLNIKAFNPLQGITVTKRDPYTNAANKALFRILTEPNKTVYIVGDFNNWGENWKNENGEYTNFDKRYQLTHNPIDPHYQEIEIDVYHGMPYGFLIDGKIVFDPSALYYTPKNYRHPIDPQGIRGLNVMSVFWDLYRNDAPKTLGPVDLRGKPLIILETDLYGLIEKFSQGLADKSKAYKYITESGIINVLKESGINMIWFLPITQGDDGDIWHFRYLQYGLRAPSSLYGTPDEFIQMVNAFKKAGIGLMLDITIAHYAINGNIPPRQFLNSGLANWTTTQGNMLYGSQKSPWGTYFYDFTNPYVRKFLIDNIIWLIKTYGISGLRLDAVDHLIGKYEPHKQYDTQNNKYYNHPQAALDFIKELISTIHAYEPSIFVVAERFENINSNILIKTSQNGGIGINARFSPQIWNWVKHNYRAKTEDLNLYELQRVFNSLVKNNELFQVTFISSHDKASNVEDPFSATGAYLASLVKEGGFFHQRGKAVSFTSLITLINGASTHLMQDIILQEGDFYHNTNIDWSQLNKNYGTYRFITDLYKFISSDVNSNAFSFTSLNPNILHNIDNENKVIILYRTDFQGNDYYILINLGHREFIGNYRFSIYNPGSYKIVLNSDDTKYQGTGKLYQYISHSDVFNTKLSTMQEQLAYSLSIPYIPPYGVLILKKIN